MDFSEMKRADISGERFGRLTAVRLVGLKPTAWLCVCECGTEKTVLLSNLRAGKQLSCGCYRAQRSTKHGKHGAPIYRVWNAMTQRCGNPNDRHYADYGGRGIAVCAEWLEFSKFYEYVGDQPPNMTLDRIDNDRGYEPGNVRWVTRKVQSRNTRVTTMLAFGGRTQSLDDWADELGVSRERIRGRLRRGWDVAAALTSPYRSACPKT